MQRDDLVCDSEDDVLKTIETFLKRQAESCQDDLRKELMMCVRFEKLDTDTLMELAKSNLMKGME